MKNRIWGNGFEAIKPIADEIKEERPDLSGDVVWQLAEELNEEYFVEDMDFLRHRTGDVDMVIFADLDLWDGHKKACKEIKGNVADLLSVCVGKIFDWYIEDGEMWIDDKHHDGCNRYRVRAWKDGVDDFKKGLTIHLAENGFDGPEDINVTTRPLGDVVAKAYGWKEE